MDVDYRYLKSKFDAADTDNSGNLTRREIFKLVSTLNIDVPNKVINSIFEEVDRDKSGTLEYDEFLQFMEKLRNRYGCTSFSFS